MSETPYREMGPAERAQHWAGESVRWHDRHGVERKDESRQRDLGRADVWAQLETARQIGRVADALDRFATVAEWLVEDAADFDRESARDLP